MSSIHKRLITFSYNITGCYEDSKDIVQDVLEKYIGVDTSRIENESNFLVKSVINHSINFKKKQQRIREYQGWLPEPVETGTADEKILSEETATFSMLILMEHLTPKERAVFVLKEGFSYSHEEIAEVISTTVENSRKLLSRAKQKLGNSAFSGIHNSKNRQEVHTFAEAIHQGDVRRLEEMLCHDICLTADGGPEGNVVVRYISGSARVLDVLIYVYNTYQKDLVKKFVTINHQPGILYLDKNNNITSCQVFEINEGQLQNIYSVVYPQKLINLNS